MDGNNKRGYRLERGFVLFLSSTSWRWSRLAAGCTACISVGWNMFKYPHAFHCSKFVITGCCVDIRSDTSSQKISPHFWACKNTNHPNKISSCKTLDFLLITMVAAYNLRSIFPFLFWAYIHANHLNKISSRHTLDFLVITMVAVFR